MFPTKNDGFFERLQSHGDPGVNVKGTVRAMCITEANILWNTILGLPNVAIRI